MFKKLPTGDWVEVVAMVDENGNLLSSASARLATDLAAGIAPVATQTAATSLQVKAGPGVLAGLSVTSGDTGGYVMLFDAVAVPADGAVTPIKAWALDANSTLELGYQGRPLKLVVGALLVFSATGPFLKTAGPTAFMSGEVL